MCDQTFGASLTRPLLLYTLPSHQTPSVLYTHGACYPPYSYSTLVLLVCIPQPLFSFPTLLHSSSIHYSHHLRMQHFSLSLCFAFFSHQIRLYSLHPDCLLQSLLLLFPNSFLQLSSCSTAPVVLHFSVVGFQPLPNSLNNIRFYCLTSLFTHTHTYTFFPNSQLRRNSAILWTLPNCNSLTSSSSL